MCEAIEGLIKDALREGEISGEERGEKIGEIRGKVKVIVGMIRKKRNKRLELNVISKDLELEYDYVKNVTEVLSEDSEKTDLQVAELLIEQEKCPV